MSLFAYENEFKSVHEKVEAVQDLLKTTMKLLHSLNVELYEVQGEIKKIQQHAQNYGMGQSLSGGASVAKAAAEMPKSYTATFNKTLTMQEMEDAYNKGWGKYHGGFSSPNPGPAVDIPFVPDEKESVIDDVPF